MSIKKQLKQLPDALRLICQMGTDKHCYCDDCVRHRVAADLAIKIAEAIAANPDGFRNWARLTGFEI